MGKGRASGAGAGAFDFDDNKPLVLCGVCCCCVVLIVSVTLVACSFSLLEPHEYGLEYNTVSLQLFPETYTNGRYFLGLGNRFEKFPRKLQYVEFSGGGAVDVWSKDGQEILVEVGFYYRLQKDKIVDLYYRFEHDFESVVVAIAASALRDVATSFDTIEFFTNRESINVRMRTELQQRIRENVFADIARFELLGITVPAGFEAAVVDKVVSSQTNEILRTEQLSSTIRQQIRIVDAIARKDINTYNAEAQYNATLIRRTAEAEVTESYAAARAAALREFALRLNLTTTDGVRSAMNPGLGVGVGVGVGVGIEVVGGSWRIACLSFETLFFHFSLLLLFLHLHLLHLLLLLHLLSAGSRRKWTRSG